MTETSYPWGGTTVGDATLAPYSDDVWSDLWRLLFTPAPATQGVIPYLNNLAVTGTASPLVVSTGAGMVDGKVYICDGALAVAIPTPAGATRIDRIVLRKDWAAQTVRVTVISGAEGGGAPSLVQIDGTTWDIPLAQASITTGGAITVTDERVYLSSPGSASGQPLSIESSIAPFSGRAAAAKEQIESSGAGTDKPVIWQLRFDDTTIEARQWNGYMRGTPGILKLKISYRMAGANTSKNVKFVAAIAAISDGDTSVSAKVFASSNSQTVVCPDTANVQDEMTITMTNQDNIALGDQFFLVLYRDTGVASDATGDAIVTNVELLYN